MREKLSFKTILKYLILILASIVAVFPLLWIILSAFKGPGEISQYPTNILPKQWTFENFRYVLSELNFGDYIVNSLVIALATTFIAVTISALAAYGVVRFFPRVGKALTRVLITTYMFPPILLAIPYSVIIGSLGLVNTRIGLIIVYLSFSVPYAVWLLVGFFETVPLGIEEAASIDGANKLQVFIQVVLPIVAPGLVATAIYTFINAWNEFLYSLILINSKGKMTIAVALRALENQEILDWGQMMAASTLVVLPSVVFFVFIQNKISSGLAEGATK